MKSNWIKIHSSDKTHMVEIISAILTENNIPSFIVNKKDSVNKFLSHGEIEIFVEGEKVIQAKNVLKKNLL